VAWLSGNPDAVRFAAWRGKTNAAIALMLASGGLLAARHGRPRLANGLGSSCSALGLATLLEYVMRVDFGIDQWLARDWVFAESALYPNRMAPNAAVSFFVVGIAICLARSQIRWRALLAQVLGTCVLTASVAALIGYLYEVPLLYKPTSFIRISPYIACGLALSSAGILGLRHDLGLSALLASHRLGGHLARRLLIVTLALPILLNWILSEGQRRGWYAENASDALSAISIGSVLAAIILFMGRSLDTVDRKRQQSERYLREANQLTSALARANTVEEVVRVTLELGLPALGARSGAMLRLSDDGKSLRVLSSQGYARETLREYAVFSVDAQVPAAEAIRIGEPVFVSSAEEYRRRYPSVPLEHLRPDHRAWAVLPLEGQGRRLGAIALSFDDSRNLDANGRQRIARLAWQCAQALDRALLVDSEREIRERARAALEAATIGTYNWEIGSLFLSHDAGIKRIFGFDGGECRSLEDYSARIHPEDREAWRTGLARSAEEGVDFEMRYRVQHPSGAVRWVLDKGRVSQSPAGGPRSLTGAVVDFSNEQRAREQAEQANRAKDEFLALLGHELRNPLSPIVTSLQLMKLRAPDQLQRERAVIERQVHHMIRLVDDLLDVSRITRGKIELRKVAVELHDVVAQALEVTSPLLEARRHGVSVDVPPSGLLLDADPARLSQVVSNLLTNAAKYTEPGGRIAISAARSEDRIILTVSDTGAGIAPELLPKIFDSFVQGARTIDRSQGGLGLGLALVRSLIERHGGTVTAESEGLGKGSRFIVVLPARVQDEQPPASRNLLTVAVTRETSRRVLVVDDNRDAADTLGEALSRAGHQVRIVYDGPSALAVAEEFELDVAFLDIGLPVMDGYEVARRLRGRSWHSRPSLIALTGYGQATDRQRAAEAGFDLHLVKPITLETALELAGGRGAARVESAPAPAPAPG